MISAKLLNMGPSRFAQQSGPERYEIGGCRCMPESRFMCGCATLLFLTYLNEHPVCVSRGGDGLKSSGLQFMDFFVATCTVWVIGVPGLATHHL